MSDIAERREQIERERHKKLAEAMDWYDKTVYYPAKRQLFEDCLADGGHRGGKYHDNGFGWSWFYCGRCGGRYDITGPNGEKK